MKHEKYCPSIGPKFETYDWSSYINCIVNYLEPDTKCHYLLHCTFYHIDNEWYSLAKDYDDVVKRLESLYNSGCTYEDVDFSVRTLKEGVEKFPKTVILNILSGVKYSK